MTDGQKIKKIFLIIFVTLALIFALISSAKISAAIYIREKTNGGTFVPIIVYNGVYAEASENNLAVTFSELDADLAYLFDKGYTTILMRDLINFNENKAALPDKPIIITFDIGDYNDIIKIITILKKYTMKAVFSVAGASVQQNPENDIDNASLSWENILSITKSGYIEFVNQSYNMHSINGRQGSSRMSDETLGEYKNAFIADTMKLQSGFNENCKFKPQAYTFPFGFVCSEAVDILQSLGFKACLTRIEKANYIVGGSKKFMVLNRYCRISGVSTQDFFKKALLPLKT